MIKPLLIILLGLMGAGCAKEPEQVVLKNVEYKIITYKQINSYSINHNGKTVSYSDLKVVVEYYRNIIRYNYFGQVEVAVGKDIEFLFSGENSDDRTTVILQKEEIGCTTYPGRNLDCHHVFRIK